MNEILVAKIGGSTLGSHDTTVDDIAALHQRGLRCVVVHGGGVRISEWLSRHNLQTRFERGLRVTDAETLEVVVAVLAGLVNKELVAALQQRGASTVGLSGADAGILKARIADEKLGFVGDITDVDTAPVLRQLDAGFIPVFAPIALEWEGERPTGRLLNINADAAAGAIAAALGARWLALLTDVPGITAEGQVLPRISKEQAGRLIEAQVIEGGMIPKVAACLKAASAGCRSVVMDGRREHALLALVEDQAIGTAVGSRSTE